MIVLGGGVVTLIVTLGIFWLCLPRNGKYHRFVDTEWEPYVAVAFCAGFALSFTMIVSASLNMVGGQ